MGCICLTGCGTRRGFFFNSYVSLTSKPNLYCNVLFHIYRSTFVNKDDLVFSAGEINSEEKVIVSFNCFIALLRSQDFIKCVTCICNLREMN